MSKKPEWQMLEGKPHLIVPGLKLRIDQKDDRGIVSAKLRMLTAENGWVTVEDIGECINNRTSPPSKKEIEMKASLVQRLKDHAEAVFASELAI